VPDSGHGKCCPSSSQLEGPCQTQLFATGCTQVNIVTAVCCRRSLFEKDKLMFAFLLAARIMGSHGQLEPEEWMFLLTGGLGK
jgi:hypothetical protein